MTHDEITKALSDEYWLVRYQALEHPNVTVEHIAVALCDENWHVRYSAIEQQKATAEHIVKALTDKEWLIRNRAEQLLLRKFPWAVLDLPDKNHYFKDVLLRLLGTR